MGLDIALKAYHNRSMSKRGFTYIDLFSGIGGFKIGLDAVGGKSLGYSEIDKYALETYKQNFQDKDDVELGDVTKITKIPHVDMLVGGVPCQSWSIAGKKRGFDDPRGKLWYDTIRMVELAKPKVFIFENVKGLFDPRNRENLNLILDNLTALGYECHYQLLNSYDYDVPQNRSRIFIVGFKKGLHKFSKRFSYPSPQASHSTVAEHIENLKIRKIIKKKFDPHTIYGAVIPKSRNAFQKEDEINDFFIFCDTRNGHTTIHSWDLLETSEAEKLICMTILQNRRKKKYGDFDGNPLSYANLKELIPGLKKKDLNSLLKKRILKLNYDKKYDLVHSKNSAGINNIYRVFLPNSKIFSTLTATGTKDFIATDYVECDDPKEYKQAFIDQIYKTGKFRQITAREAARIQGFPDDFMPHSNERHAQKQFGNAVSPPVVESLARQILATGVLGGKSQLAPAKGRFVHYTYQRGEAHGVLASEQLELLAKGSGE